MISSQQFFQLLSTLLTSLTFLNLLTSSHYSKHFSPLLSSPLLTVSQIFVPLISASQLVTSLNTHYPVTTFWTLLNALLDALLYSSHLCSLLVPWSTLLASSKFVSPLQPSSSRLVSPLLNATNSIWGWADFTSSVTRSFSWKLLCTQPQHHGTLIQPLHWHWVAKHHRTTRFGNRTCCSKTGSERQSEKSTILKPS